MKAADSAARMRFIASLPEAATACRAALGQPSMQPCSEKITPARATKFPLASVEHAERVPAPVDPVAPDQAILNLHDFHQFHLIAVRSRPRIFPGDHAAVAKEAGSVAFALRRVGRKHQ